MSTALIWVRHDLRLHDNPALSQAIKTHEQVISVYIHASDDPIAVNRHWKATKRLKGS